MEEIVIAKICSVDIQICLMREILDWNHVRAFLATANEGSLSAAARKLGLTQPTLGRQVTALEEDLGLMLFERIGRKLVLTSAGLELLGHVTSMGEAADRVSLVASGQSQSIDGLIRISASDMSSAHLLPPVLKQLRKIAPELEVDVIATNQISDLLRREADIAIRHVRPEQPELIARLLRDAKAHFYGTRDYLDRMGRPRTLEELAMHDFVSFGDTARMVQYLVAIGIPVTDKNFKVGSESGVVAWELTRHGFGLAPMSDDIATKFPDVEMVMPEMEAITFPLWLTTHRELHTSRRIRLVFDLLAECL